MIVSVDLRIVANDNSICFRLIVLISYDFKDVTASRSNAIRRRHISMSMKQISLQICKIDKRINPEIDATKGCFLVAQSMTNRG